MIYTDVDASSGKTKKEKEETLHIHLDFPKLKSLNSSERFQPVMNEGSCYYLKQCILKNGSPWYFYRTPFVLPKLST